MPKFIAAAEGVIINQKPNFSTTTSHHKVKIRFTKQTDDNVFEDAIDGSINRIIQFSMENNLGIQSAGEFVSYVRVYSSKEDFDRMILDSPDWPKNTLVPKTYVGVGQKKSLHVISWSGYSKIHPNDAYEDYRKLLSHELAHLLHVAYLKGNEDLMGPTWFFEGFACFVAGQYLGGKLPDHTTMIGAMSNPKRGSYRTYAAILNRLSKLKPIRYFLDHAADADFSEISESLLSSHKKESKNGGEHASGD